MIQVTLKGDVREFESGITIADVAKSIGMGLYKAACGGRVNGAYCDLRTPLTEDCTLEIVTFDDVVFISSPTAEETSSIIFLAKGQG